ncbi:hypothetical protein GQ44DRAFT_764122 [Phaeosphaeriaceae sp. PMI808]|nr:hypothetical protein GQ44DRAFT_764122 [Phaeosphaeriaceae sp. PMI808]
MKQFDGASESKPIKSTAFSPYPSSTTLARTNTHQSPSLYKRFASLFKHKNRATTGIPTDADIQEVQGSHSPLRILSPRVTESEPPPQSKRTFSLKGCQSNKISKAKPVPTSATAPQLDRLAGAMDHISVTRAPYQFPRRQGNVSLEIVGTPASPSKEAALTSHPIV